MGQNTTLKRSLFTLFLVVCTELIGFGLIIPILPQLATQFDVPSLYIGFLLASYSLAQFVAAPILGGLSDKYGRKRIFIISKIGTCLAYILLAFSKTYVMFLVARLLDGFTGGNIATARAYVADITSPEDRPKGMAVIGISFGLGFILGPALGGFLYGDDGSHMMASLVAGALSFVALLFTIFVLKEPEKRQVSEHAGKWRGFLSLLGHPAVKVICAIQLLYMVIFSGFETTFSVFTQAQFGFSARDNSWLFMYAGILALFVQGFIMRKTSPHKMRMVKWGFGITGVSFFLLAFSGQVMALLVSLALFSIGIGLVNSYLPAVLSVSIPAGEQGQSMGLFESLGSLGRILGPTFAYLSVFSGMDMLYLFYGSVLLLVLVLSFLRRDRLTT